MKTLQKWAVAMLVGVVAGNAAGLRNDEVTVSEWSKVSSNLMMRVTCPRYYEIDRTNHDFFVKCEVKNAGKENTVVYQRARIFLVDEAGQTNKCLRYNDGVYARPVLKPGETTGWWQNGKAPGEGQFQLYVRWDEDEGVESPPTPISIRTVTLQEKELERIRTLRIQEHADEFVTLVPNTALEKVAYTKVLFTNDPVIVNGWLYNAFSFTMPEQEGDLVWSFVLEDFDHNGINFYIAPAQGTMEGFKSFVPQLLKADVSHVAKKGDAVIFQTLDRSRLKAGGRYIIWLQCMYRDIPSVMVSLNILDKRGKSFSDIFPETYGAGLKAKREKED